jgi:hypothetical protein
MRTHYSLIYLTHNGADTLQKIAQNNGENEDEK